MNLINSTLKIAREMKGRQKRPGLHIVLNASDTGVVVRRVMVLRRALVTPLCRTVLSGSEVKYVSPKSSQVRSGYPHSLTATSVGVLHCVYANPDVKRKGAADAQQSVL